MHKGWVTVLTPTIPGREGLLKRAVSSVEAQSRKPQVHAITVDHDGIGCAEMKNRMLHRVVTEWVAFLDDDDELLPTHIELLMYAAEHTSGVDVFYPWFEAVGWEDIIRCPVGGSMRSPLGVPFGEEQREYILHKDNFIPCTVLARTEAILDAGGFAPIDGGKGEFFDRDDLSLWRRMLLGGSQFVHVPAITWRYYREGQNTGGESWRRLGAAAQR